VVFTGSLPNNLSRAKAQELARRLGAKATPQTVSKSTDVVVAGEKGGKKLVRASELGIRIIEAEEFVKIVEEYTSSIIK
jgi:DNA ligase (NAD+)